jgi:hypothetical protein
VTRFQHLGRLLKRVAVFIVILVIGNFAAEWYVGINLGPGLWEFRRSHPAGYARSPFYSSEFIDEQTALSGSWQQGDTLSGWDSNFHGRFFNTSGGIRATTFQPPAASHTVWMLGNSTLFGYEVPDELTIPSQLQRLLNAAYGPHYRVVNLGQTGLGIPQNLRLLKRLPVRPGDIVIAYEGLSEGFTLRLSEETRRDRTLAGKACNWLTSGSLRSLGGWGLIHLYCRWAESSITMGIVDPAQPMIEQTGQMVEDYLTEAYRYTTERGADYYHFLPPHIWSKLPSVYERSILNNPILTPLGTAQSFALMWPALQSARDRLAKAGICSYDLTNILNRARTEGHELYLDFIHVNEEGNGLIAQAIFSVIGKF